MTQPIRNSVTCNMIVKAFIKKSKAKYGSVLNQYLSKFDDLDRSAECLTDQQNVFIYFRKNKSQTT